MAASALEQQLLLAFAGRLRLVMLQCLLAAAVHNMQQLA
jgi:hypothetical protein